MNSHEFAPIPSPAAANVGLPNGRALAESLTKQPGYLSSEVIQESTGNATTFMPDTPMTPVHEDAGVTQELYGIIQAGDDYFGIVKVKAVATNNTLGNDFILTRFATDKRPASVIGSLKQSDEPISVGRSKDSSLSESVSREHFKMAQKSDGEFAIGDLNSTNGTVLYHATRDFTPYNGNPVVDNPNLWAASATSAKEELFSTYYGRYVEAEPIAPEIIPNANLEKQKNILDTAARVGQIGEISDKLMITLVDPNSPLDAKLSEADAAAITTASDMVSRMLVYALDRDTAGTLITDSNVVEKLKRAFDLPVLSSDTSPKQDFNWESIYEVRKKAGTIQSALFDKKSKVFDDIPEAARGNGFGFPKTLNLLCEALDEVMRNVARNNTLGSKFDVSYLNKSLREPFEEVEKIAGRFSLVAS